MECKSDSAGGEKKGGAVIFVDDCAKSLFRALLKWKRNIPPAFSG